MIIAILTSALFVVSAPQTGAQETVPCDSCGMALDETAQARYVIVDPLGTRYYACCPACAFKLLKAHSELTITSFCDYNGPSSPITLSARNHGSDITVNPTSAVVILGGGCTKNRLVYNTQAADALLSAPNFGTSQWLSTAYNVTVPSSATRLSIAAAVLQFGGGESMTCEACGMTVDVASQSRCRIFDDAGNLHIACCPVCGLKLLKTYGSLDYTAICDYTGPSNPISISARNYGATVTVTPSTALVIVGGGCTKNRLVADSASADALLASPYYGVSPWLTPTYNVTVASNATRLSIAQAALQYGGGPPATPTPTPTIKPASTQSSPTHVPNQTPAPTITPDSSLPERECEACGMIVTADDQWHFKITDGDGNPVYAECFLCAVHLIKQYDSLHIETFCDYYGSDYKITIDSTGKGQHVTVSPSTAMVLYVESNICENNRVAYNQTAADYLTSNYTELTSKLQQHDWPTPPTVMTVYDNMELKHILTTPEPLTGSPSSLVMPVAVVVSIAIFAVLAFLGLKKLKK